jgi:hypothetical protein
MVRNLMLLRKFHSHNLIVVGDSLINRDTIPLRFGSSSRTALLLGVVAWSIGLSWIWDVDPYSAVAFTALGVYAGGRFVKYTTVDEDRNSYLYYNVRECLSFFLNPSLRLSPQVWVSVAHILPGYWRLFRAT